MLYRGFYIYTTAPVVLHRWNKANRRLEPCIGAQCEVYDKYDTEMCDCLDSVRLAVGQDVPDIDRETIERAIRDYVDEYNVRLHLTRNEVLMERRNALLGNMISRLGVTLEPGELYDLLSENVGMTDEEIRDCGFLSLVPFFDRPAYARTIAQFMIHRGSEHTISGNRHFGFEIIDERFGTDLAHDEEMVELIRSELMEHSDILSEVDDYDNDFDLMFFLNYCPFSDRDEEQIDEEQDADRIGKDIQMAMKTQKISVEYPLPRYRALHYYLEKNGRTLEEELRKHLDQVYREQVPKDVQEYVQVQNPDMEDFEEPENTGPIKHRRPGRKQDPIVSGPGEQMLNL